MSRRSRWRDMSSPSKLKKSILEGLIDKENKRKLSDREFMRIISPTLTTDGNPVGCGIYTYITKHPDIIRADPMAGKRIDEKCVFDYAIEQGYWTEDEVPYSEFTKDTQKIKNKLDDLTLQRGIENDIFGFTLSDILPLPYRRSQCLIAVGDSNFKKIETRCKKQILSGK